MPDTHAAAALDRESAVGDFDVIVIGAGMSGLYLIHRLRQLGVRFRVFDNGSDVGGTWYWNRYPGARFDSESWSYGFAFSEEVLQEWNWREHFSAQPDTLAYMEYVADKFDFRRDIQFDSELTAALWDEEARLWRLAFDVNGTRQEYSTRLFVPALGPLSAHVMPVIEGRDTFEGRAFHTARWPKEPIDFSDKRVGIIGTGATAIQAITEIAKTVKHLTVFQRNPNWAAPLHNREITADEQKDIKARFDEIYARCRETVSCFIHNPDPRKALETPPEEREAFWEKLYSEPGFGIWMGNFSDILVNEEANKLMTAFAAKKIRQRVKDPKIADLLTPKNHGFGTRRLPLESGYYEVYNQDNVQLVDLNATPIERITPKGVQCSDREYEFDLLIFATGFDGVTGPYDRIDIRTSTGRVLREDWAEGLPRTYLGVQAEGYPNMLMVLGPHTARGNIPRNSEQIIDFVIPLIRHVFAHDITRIEPRADHVTEWGEHVERAAAPLLASQVKSWQTGVNRNVPGRDVLRVLGYNGSAVKYRKRTEREVAEGFPGFLAD
ncbi:MAG: NAD(P)/FAD-dependent oxidoreductase [Alphaproteobacteria bacterium]|nr:NAD(P)/FAD-dependent oxidoreductase [Alphaproteobacteria bacterium]MCB9931671.1 NAD(P)/FAD-dependent oxidoreductase [Alphaproteobacteria bacterium]